MKPVEEVYSGRFFRNRHKLHWRAEYVCNGIIKVLNPKSVVDVGAATGDLVAKFNELGVESYGIEGSKEAQNYVITDKMVYGDVRFDITEWGWVYPCDLCTCFEVAEHLEPEYADQFVDNLSYLSDQILISAAPPGDTGYGHLNCQSQEYWVKKFCDKGYYWCQSVAEQIKEEWYPWRKKDGIRAFFRTLMYFTKRTTNEA